MEEEEERGTRGKRTEGCKKGVGEEEEGKRRRGGEEVMRRIRGW